VAEESGFNVMVTSDQNIRYQQNLTGRKLALVVLGSNIWPLVQRHAETITANVNAATTGSYAFNRNAAATEAAKEIAAPGQGSDVRPDRWT
jgi:hypothetical protein